MRHARAKTKKPAIPARSVRQPQRAKRNLAIRKPSQPTTIAESIEKVLIEGDLTPLSPAERLQYYRVVCNSLGINYLTQPFTYILFREADNTPPKLQLYANKDCAAQLRKLHRISIIPPLRREIHEGMCIVEADLRDGHGTTDSATGVVPLWKWKDGKRIDLSGREWANAVMKCETKAKRRGTLSICGLAFLDESELDTMQVLGGVTPDGRIFQYAQPRLPEASEVATDNEESNPYLQRYHEREQEALRKLTPEQREIVERRMKGGDAHAQSASTGSVQAVAGGSHPAEQHASSLFYTQKGDTYMIDGAQELKSANKDLLGPLWNQVAHAIVATPAQLGRLISQFEDRKVPFKELKS